MAAKIHTIDPLCCGTTAYIVELGKSIKKKHVPAFINAGYLVPESYTNLGLFYSQKNSLIATCSFGRTSINIRCGGSKCDEYIKNFAETADRIVEEDK